MAITRARAIFLVAAIAATPVCGESRTWTDATGVFSSEADLLDVAGGVVYLRKTTGATVSVPVAKLSRADQAYLSQKFPPRQIIEGKVVGVADGDTLTIVDDVRNQTVIRLEGIDAPEGGQDYGDKAKRALSAKVFGRRVLVECKEKDKYGRTVGQVFADGKWVNKQLIDQGCAWHYKEYSTSLLLADAETRAKDGRVGLWAATSPQPPWEFRHPSPDEIAAAAAENGNRPQALLSRTPAAEEGGDTTVYVTNTGTKYHRAGCRHLSKSKIPISLSEAAGRYSPCSVCDPPAVSAKRSAASAPSYTPSFSPSSGGGGGEIHVKGYFRKDGTYVRPHTRSRPSR